MVELGLVPRKTVSKPGSQIPRPPAFKSFGRTSLKYEGFQVSWQLILWVFGCSWVLGAESTAPGSGEGRRQGPQAGPQVPRASISMPVLKMGAGWLEGAEALSSFGASPPT